ncbi:protein Red [Cimex lectularius]|uniref:Protein Red n=1 Tax=Cimex lectularius TaxID=79782 RepID=A0A8I6TG28_CIMLE|nr:protein Red [Cimex lectularius]
MPEYEFDEGDRSQRLTNDDFRRLLMTPRSTPSAAPTPQHTPAPETGEGLKKPASDDRGERRRKKKIFYAKLKKQEENKLAELAEKYRDRAKERRDGSNADYQPDDPMSTSSGYRAVAPDLKSGIDAAERRRQMIQESKFLGGDMEHTHLVKGLDYALLQKVRSEIQMKEAEQEEELEKLVAKPKKEKKKEEEEIVFKTALGRNIHKVVMESNEVERNPLFAPGRMAYVVELTDDTGESDIPTTLLRSMAEIPNQESVATLTTNDIVINKLAQILSYLRQGPRHHKKSKKRDKMGDEGIFPDAGDYVPSSSKSAESRKKISNYFKDTDKDKSPPPRVPDGKKVSQSSKKETRAAGLLSRLAAEPTGYAECYPGLDEMQDAIDDSDDEVDYTKMDQGNKKGPVGRWDFDTQEEYSQYMNTKEALPKAAFQYGVKMADGRRTRKYNKEKNERAELDREWNKIQNIIQKRKGPEDPAPPQFKIPRY